MPGHFSFFTQNIQNNVAVFDENDTRHAIQALRYQMGDEISFSDGLGNRYKGNISQIEKRAFQVTITQKETPDYQPQLHIAVGIIKHADRLEWLVEKCTELGVKSIAFLQTGNVEKARINPERLQKVAIAALKQCHGYRLPEIRTSGWKDILQENHRNRLICHCNTDIQQPSSSADGLSGDCLVLLGPEGDFTTEEVNQAIAKGFQCYSLGALVLRTETACMAIAARYLG
ncbi:MAG: 16S rRNA (uracil(1498)-N(3))-methyltransferase [Sphingomonadales bacterium]|nr:16S rRNA (uracil(1498)-N(3))-methyltransferase [Sphingomonadales bacterium]